MEIDADNEIVEKYKRDYLPRLILFRKNGLQMTQKELAEELGCTRANVSKFEKGKTLSGKILTYYITHGLAEFLLQLESWARFMR